MPSVASCPLGICKARSWRYPLFVALALNGRAVLYTRMLPCSVVTCRVGQKEYSAPYHGAQATCIVFFRFRPSPPPHLPPPPPLTHPHQHTHTHTTHTRARALSLSLSLIPFLKNVVNQIFCHTLSVYACHVLGSYRPTYWVATHSQMWKTMFL